MVDVITDGKSNTTGATSTGTAVLVLEPAQGAGGSTSAQKPRVQRVAGMLHQAIDKVEQQLRAGSGSAMAKQAGLAQQATRYQGQLVERIDTQPLQSVGIAFAAGLILDKLLARPAKVRTVRVPAPRREPVQAVERATASRLQGLRHGIDSGLGRVSGAARGAVGTAGAAAGAGVAGTKALANALALKASTLPLVMQLAAERLRNKSLRYGGLARTGVQAHPMVGVGAAFGGAALVTALVLQRRSAAARDPFATGTTTATSGTTGERSKLAALPARTRDAVAARPVAAGAVVLGLGALLGALLARR